MGPAGQKVGRKGEEQMASKHSFWAIQRRQAAYGATRQGKLGSRQRLEKTP